jgi:hypothetical protein
VQHIVKKLRIKLLCEPTIPFIGIYLKEYKSGYTKDTCTPIFIAALFIITNL